MAWEIRPFDETNKDDFKVVVRARFREVATRLVDKILRNPVRNSGSDAGVIGYENGKPACVRAAIRRRLYFGHEEFYGTVGCMLAKIHGADRSLLMSVVGNSIAPRDGSKIFFTNTSVAACVRLNHAAGVAGEGIRTWMSDQIAVFHPLSRWWWRMTKIHPRLPKLHFRPWSLSVERSVEACYDDNEQVIRLTEIERDAFASFWTRYLEKNKGLVASRTVEELEWMYEDRVSRGRVVFFGYFKKGELFGYIVVSNSNDTCRFWQVVDWIAVENNEIVLDRLMECACLFIKHHTPAIQLAIRGFPEWVRPIVKHFAPLSVPLGHNPYLFHCYDQGLLERIRTSETVRQNWFWGPYDGDMCF